MPESPLLEQSQTLQINPSAPKDHLFEVTGNLEQSREIEMKPVFIPIGAKLEWFRKEVGGAAAQT